MSTRAKELQDALVTVITAGVTAQAIKLTGRVTVTVARDLPERRTGAKTPLVAVSRPVLRETGLWANHQREVYEVRIWVVDGLGRGATTETVETAALERLETLRDAVIAWLTGTSCARNWGLAKYRIFRWQNKWTVEREPQLVGPGLGAVGVTVEVPLVV